MELVYGLRLGKNSGARKERSGWLGGVGEEGEAGWLRERQEEEEEKRRAHEEEMSRRPRMSAWLRRNEPQHAAGGVGGTDGG